MKKQKLKDLKKLLQIIKKEQKLNEELIEYDLEELTEKIDMKNSALSMIHFYTTLSFTAESYSSEKRELLFNQIMRSTENGVEFPQNSNEAINIAAENAWQAKKLQEQIDLIRDDIFRFEGENKDLQTFKVATKKQIQKIKKKKVNKK